MGFSALAGGGEEEEKKPIWRIVMRSAPKGEVRVFKGKDRCKRELFLEHTKICEVKNTGVEKGTHLGKKGSSIRTTDGKAPPNPLGK